MLKSVISKRPSTFDWNYWEIFTKICCLLV